MSVNKKSISFSEQVAQLRSGRLSRMMVSEYYSARNNGGRLELHSTAPGCLDNEFVGILPANIPALAHFFNVLAGRQVDSFLQELKELKPNEDSKKKNSSKNKENVSGSAA